MVIAVILPTFNEQDNITEMIDRVLKQQEFLPQDTLHIVVSDSHSQDKTEQVVRQIGAKNAQVHFLDVQERGIGIGIIKGYQWAIANLNADILVSLDADLSHPPEIIPQMIAKIKAGDDWVIGSRYAKGAKNAIEPHRIFLSWAANMFSRLVMGVYNLKEFTASYRALTREMFQRIDLNNIPWQSKSFIIQPSIAYELISKGAKFSEVPMIFVDRKNGKSKLNTYLYTKELLQYGFKVRIKKSKQFIKFLMVGGTGFIINFIGLNVFWHIFNMEKPIASSLGAEIAIISNFFLNNYWTFKHRKNESNMFLKFLQFNISSFGAIVIQFVVIYLGEQYITPIWNIAPESYAANMLVYLYFIIAVGFGLIYNYIMYSRVIWKKTNSEAHIVS
ncbi:MAG: glycosyltransferase [bacterium]|nr:glycosyltransferase [bacterium]